MEGALILVVGIAGLLAGSYFIKAYLLQRHLIRSQQSTLAVMGEQAERIQSTHEQFHKLYTYLQTVREEERIRVAREIHDDVGQILTVVKMDISKLNKKLKSNDQSGTEPLAVLASMNDKIGTTINSIRKIVAELRPEVLDHLGLIEAIEWVVQSFQDQIGIVCSLRSNLRKIKLDHNRAVAVFRAFEGILSVAVRRAEVGSLIVTVQETGNILTVHVQDNGTGPRDTAAAEEIALILMESEERITSIGGTFSFVHHTEDCMQVTIVIHTI